MISQKKIFCKMMNKFQFQFFCICRIWAFLHLILTYHMLWIMLWLLLLGDYKIQCKTSKSCYLTQYWTWGLNEFCTSKFLHFLLECKINYNLSNFLQIQFLQKNNNCNQVKVCLWSQYNYNKLIAYSKMF